MRYKRIVILMIFAVIITLITGCSRQQIGYSVLKMLGFDSGYSYLDEIETATELKLSDEIEAVVNYDRHPQEGNDINFYSAKITQKEDIDSVIEQISNNNHWNRTPMESNDYDAIYETDALKEAGFPKVNNGYYIFYWEFDSSTADAIENVYGIPEDKISKINAQTCKNLGYFDIDTNTLYFITFFKNSLKP